MKDIKQGKGFVIMLDALGMKANLKSEACDEVIEKWQVIVRKTRKLISDLNKDNSVLTEINVRVFSDTFIITFLDEESDLINLIKIIEQISKVISTIILDGIILDLKFRGAISAGRLFISDDIIGGDAIVDAAEWYEQLNMLGVFATPRMSYILDKLDKIGKFDEFIRYNSTPLINNKNVELWIVNWLKAQEYYEKNDNVYSKSNIYDKIFCIENIPPEVLDKYINTKKFLEEIGFMTKLMGNSEND